MAVSETRLRKFIRQELLWNVPLPPEQAGVVNAGFMLKPTTAGSYANRVRPHYICVYVLRGTGTFTDWHARQHRVRQGHFIQMPAERMHSVVQDGDGRWAESFISLNPRFTAVLLELGAMDPEARLLDPGLDLGLLLLFDTMLRLMRQPDPHAHRLALAKAHELLVEVQRLDARRRGPARGDEAMEHARYLLGADLHRPLDPRELAAGFGLSYERFRKIFRAHFGLAPHQYRIQRRIEHAQTLLAEENQTLKETAYALGYPDPFSFAKQFKQVTGVSPGAYRRRHRGIRR